MYEEFSVNSATGVTEIIPHMLLIDQIFKIQMRGELRWQSQITMPRLPRRNEARFNERAVMAGWGRLLTNGFATGLQKLNVVTMEPFSDSFDDEDFTKDYRKDWFCSYSMGNFLSEPSEVHRN